MSPVAEQHVTGTCDLATIGIRLALARLVVNSVNAATEQYNPKTKKTLAII